MEYIKTPYLPQKPASLLLADGRLDAEAEESLGGRGIKLLKTEKYPGMYDAIACHPDIMLHPLGDEYIVYAPGTSENLLAELSHMGFRLIKGSCILSSEYPLDISYNVARAGSTAFHHLKHTDPVLKAELLKRGVNIVHVNQGYAKCSTAIIDEKSIITSDAGIAKAAAANGIEALLIEPEKGILLPGLDYGFIGGCSGLVAKNIWAVAGCFDKLSSADRIRAFLAQRGIDILSLGKGEVVDIGSIIPLMTF